MQLVVKGGAIIAHYPDDASVPLDQFPGAVIQPFSGSLAGLGRVGDAPPEGQFDSRPLAAPALGLADYAAWAYRGALTHGIEVNVAANGAPPKAVLVDGTDKTIADLALLARYGQARPAGTRVWVDNLGVETVLTGAELVTLADLQGAWVSALVPAFTAIQRGLAAAPPTVTTTAQVDALLEAAANG